MSRVAVALLSLSLLAAPLAAEAQRATVPKIGLLDSGSLTLWEAFRDGMRQLGYVEGRTVIYEARGAEGKYERLRDLAAELVGLKVDVIVAAGTGLPAARQATATIPIVGTSVALEPGLAASLARPGGNVTGVASLRECGVPLPPPPTVSERRSRLPGRSG